MKFTYELPEPTEVEVLQERVTRLESVLADLIKVVGGTDIGSEYYLMDSNFQKDTKQFEYDHYNNDKKEY